MTSYANLRAPTIIPHNPSSALYQVTDAQVLAETLTAECTWQRCNITVHYQIEATKPISAKVDFILAKEAPVTVKVGQNVVAVQKKSVPFEDPREQDLELETFSQSKSESLFKAEFPLNVDKGQHEIFITYPQPLSLKETDYGYFSDGYYVGLFQYELWPLNEWQVAKNFKLDFHLKVNTEADWWDDLFSSANVTCFTVNFRQCQQNETTNSLCKTSKQLASNQESALSIQKQLSDLFQIV